MFVLRLDADVVPARKALVAIVLGSLALSLFALEDFLIRGGSWRDRLVRAGAPFSDFNWLATYLVLVIPVLIGWLVTQSNLAARAVGLCSLVASVLAQVAAYTRAGWVAHFVQALSVVLLIRRHRLLVWFLSGVILSGSIGLFTLSSRGYQQGTLDPWTFSARVKTWQLGFQQVLEHPIVGIGFGNNIFSQLYMAEIEEGRSKGEVEKVLSGLHNTFAMVLMGSGVPALTFFIWFIIRALRELLAGVRAADVARTRHMVFRAAIALAVIGFVIRNLFDYMFAGSLASLFWIFIAVGLSMKTEQALGNS
jgi:heptosyltransferase-3/putative inorganic carbon (HCO3(-)) transporter